MKKRNSIAYEEHEINIYHHHHRMKKKERSKNERHSPKKVQKISDIFLAPPPPPPQKIQFSHKISNVFFSSTINAQSDFSRSSLK